MTQHCMHVVAYYLHRANGSVCEDALIAMLYELEMMLGETI